LPEEGTECKLFRSHEMLLFSLYKHITQEYTSFSIPLGRNGGSYKLIYFRLQNVQWNCHGKLLWRANWNGS